MVTVKDAFGETLEAGNRVAWIANPSKWSRTIRKGTLIRINEGVDYYGRPTLTVLAEDNIYGDLGQGFKATKESTLTTCVDISLNKLGRTHFMFSRVIKL